MTVIKSRNVFVHIIGVSVISTQNKFTNCNPLRNNLRLHGNLFQCKNECYLNALLVVLYDHWKSNFTHLLKHHATERQYNKVKIEEIWDTMEI